MAHAGRRLTPPGRRGDADGPAAAELLAALPTAILVIDEEGLVRDCNPAAETLLNLARAGIVDAPITAMIGHSLTALAPDQPIAAYDLAMTLPGARPYSGDMAVSPLPDRAGWRIVAIHGHASHDLGARLADRRGRALPAAAAAAMLAHEVKNPLSGIRGAAQLLESGADAGQAALTRLIRDEVDRIARLIDRMEGLTDTRTRALEPLNIHTVLGQVRELAAAGFAAGMTIRELYDPSLPDVMGNRDALVQILVNLLKNAAEAAGRHGAITLRTAYRQGLSVARLGGGDRLALPIELAVIDDGPGVPEGIAAHMFDPFVTSKRDGTGLGLALVEKLVEEMGGIVQYRRDAGCTVLRLLLPRARDVR
ncbi:two-component system sensor histidine kinase NtrB [Sphingomonas sp.]|uniref:two-component system sensor histidine kinase NtrB n=1 Tax=Sphingomonas sp. TaxID=28214 RepID=UPI003B006D98